MIYEDGCCIGQDRKSIFGGPLGVSTEYRFSVFFDGVSADIDLTSYLIPCYECAIINNWGRSGFDGDMKLILACQGPRSL